MLNKTELANMGALEPAFRGAWIRELAKRTEAAAVASIAQMLQFDDTWELAFTALGERVAKYPRPVALQVLYTLARIDEPRRFEHGITVLRKVPAKDFDAALEAVKQIGDASSIFDWTKFGNKVRRAVRA